MLADTIRNRRLALGMSQAELARRAGLTKQQVANLERGRRGRRIRLATAQALARALGIPIYDLLNGAADKGRPGAAPPTPSGSSGSSSGAGASPPA